MIVAWCQDLMFRSKIKLAEPSPGEVVFVRRLSDVLEKAASDASAVVLVDLSVVSDDIATDLARIAEALPTHRRMAFGSHVLMDLLGRAKELGYDPVMSNGLFFSRARAILQAAVSGERPLPEGMDPTAE